MSLKTTHIKRGTQYGVLNFNPILQCSAVPSLDGKPLVLYRAESDHQWYAREYAEFSDGRFADHGFIDDWSEGRMPDALGVIGAALNLDRYANHLMGDAQDDRVEEAVMQIFRVGGYLMEIEKTKTVFESELEQAVLHAATLIHAALAPRPKPGTKEEAQKAWLKVLDAAAKLNMERQRFRPLVGSGRVHP